MKRIIKMPQVAIIAGLIALAGAGYFFLSGSDGGGAADVRSVARDETGQVITYLQTLSPTQAYLESLDTLLRIETSEAFTAYIELFFPKLSVKDMRNAYREAAAESGRDIDEVVFEIVVPLMRQTHPDPSDITVTGEAVTGTLAELTFTAPGGETDMRTGEATMVREDGYWKMLTSEISN